MNQNDLVSFVSAETGCSKQDAIKSVRAVLKGMCTGLEQDGAVSFADKFKIEVYTRSSRQGKNPSTGETMTIPAKKVLRIKLFKVFSEFLNK